MFRKRKDANEETMAMGRVVGVRNASPAHRVAALQEREGEAAITVQKSFRGMKGRQAKWYWEESAELRQSHNFLPSSPRNSVLLHGAGTSTPSTRRRPRNSPSARWCGHLDAIAATR